MMGMSLKKKGRKENDWQGFSLVWLDAQINQTKENIQIQKRLQSTIHPLRIFDDENSCEVYLRSVTSMNTILLIVSGQLGERIVPRIHSMQQISAIYVFCRDRVRNERWAKEFKKVQGVFVDFNLLNEHIQFKQLAHQSDNIDEQLSISICKTTLDPTQWFIEPNDRFVYAQVLFDGLLRLESTADDRSEVLSRCEREFTENPQELKLINEFRNHYTPSQALCWFTRNAFISNLLKRALYIQNVDLLILLRFFLYDIQEQLDKHRCVSLIRVFRSQSMPLDQFEFLKQSVGEFISINGFLSTLASRDMSLLHSTDSSDVDGSQRVLFEIDADPTVSGTKSFSSVPRLNSTSEEEILFSLGCTFRLNNVVQGEDTIWLIQMTLCSTRETQIDAVCEYLQSQSEVDITSPLLFGIVLQHLNDYDQAERYYQHLFNIFSDNAQGRSQCEAVWTILKRKKINYLTNLEAVATGESVNKDLQQASNYTYRGDYYRKRDDFPRALESYQLALTIWKKCLTDTHPEVGRCLTHIASLCHDKKEHKQALSHYQNALEIFEQHVSTDHPELKTIHHHLMDLYRSLKQYEKAVEHYEKWKSDSAIP